MSSTVPLFGDLAGGTRASPVPVEAQNPTRRANGRKDALAVGLVAAVLLTAIHAGGTPPLVSALMAIATGLLGLVVALKGHGTPTHARRSLSVLTIIACAFCATGLLQALVAHLALAAVPLPGTPISLRPGSLSPDATLVAIWRVATAAALLWLTVGIARNPARARIVGLVLFAGITAQAVWALLLLGPLGANHVSAYPGAAVGTFVGRNALATYLGFGLVLGLSLAPRAKPAPILWLGLALIGAALLATQSRMGLAASAAGVLTVLWFKRPGPKNIAAAGLIVALAVLFLGQGIAERSVWLASAGASRAALYAQVWQMIAARPLTGFGLDTFPLAFELFHRPPVATDVVWDRAHSTYLTLWAEAGLVAGSLPPLAGLMTLAALYRRRADPLAVAAMAALVLAGLHSALDFSLEIPANLFLLMTLLGLGLAAHPHSERTTP